MNNRVINTKVVPGQPTDGTGKVCIHLFVQDDAGAFTEPHLLHPVIGEDGNQVKQAVDIKPGQGYLACDRKRNPKPITLTVKGKAVTTVTHRTVEPQAVTCPKCINSAEYKALTAPLQTTT